MATSLSARFRLCSVTTDLMCIFIRRYILSNRQVKDRPLFKTNPHVRRFNSSLSLIHNLIDFYAQPVLRLKQVIAPPQSNLYHGSLTFSCIDEKDVIKRGMKSLTCKSCNNIVGHLCIWLDFVGSVVFGGFIFFFPLSIGTQAGPLG